MAITMAVSASAISAWPQTMPPCRHRRSENAIRRIAPGCQSAAAPDGGVHSMPPIVNPRSCTHGANTSPSTRLASSISNSATCCSCCMRGGSSPRIGVGGYSKVRWAERDRGGHGLKMPDLRPYDRGVGEQVDHVQAIDNDFERGRDGSCPQWLHQMRSDLGRLGAVAEILQVGPFLALGRVRLASWVARWYVAG